MNIYQENFIEEICFHYNFNIDNFIGYKAISKGHINTTYALYFDQKNIVKRYLLQQVNTNVFKDHEKLMTNIEKVTQHIKKKYKKRSIYKEKVLRIVKTKDNKNYFVSKNQNVYRIYHFIENAITFDVSNNKKILFEAGKIIGEFANNLSDFDFNELHETIINFHNTPERYKTFLESVKNASEEKRESCLEQIMFFINNSNIAFNIQKKIDEGLLPERVTHNDTKLNNLMFEYGSHKGLCLVDLDTVMKGCLCYDFGDFIRSACNSKKEDEKDVSSITFLKDFCIEFSKGFINKMKSITKEEVENLINGAITMTYECGMRFLTDYLCDNIYFKVDYKTHNLIRCKTQIEMCKQIISSKDELDMILMNIYNKKTTKN